MKKDKSSDQVENLVDNASDSPIVVQQYQMPTSVKVKLTLYVIFMCSLTFLLGVFVTVLLITNSFSGPLAAVQAPVLALAHIPADGHAEWLDFNDAVNEVDKYFYDRPKIDHAQMYYAAAEAALQTLSDNYTFFEQPQTAKTIDDQMNGHLGGGIGVEFSIINGKPTISDVYAGDPAEQAGVKIGDVIQKINGQDVANTGDSDKDLNQDGTLMKGDVGTKLTLTLLRPTDNNRVFDVIITRATIQRPAVESKLISGNIGYIKIKDSFGTNTIDEFTKQTQQLVNQGATKFILDVRDNGGGLVEAARSILGHFLPNGTAFYEKSWNGSSISQQTIDITPADSLKLYDAPLVVLVNGNSASASEITAGALQGRNRATLIGEKTFGKGVAQYVVPLNDGSAVRVTYAHWLTPKQQDINHNGLTPNIVVQDTPSDLAAGQDPQLNQAVQYLQSKQ